MLLLVLWGTNRNDLTEEMLDLFIPPLGVDVKTKGYHGAVRSERQGPPGG